MRNILFGVLACMVSSCLLRAERLPVEVFANPAAFTGMQLSRDGKFVAYKAEYENAERVFIRELETKKVLAVEVPSSSANLYGRVYGMYWVSNKRLLINTYMGYVAIDRDGDNYTMLTGAARTYGVNRVDTQYIIARKLLHASRDAESDQVLVEEYNRSASSGKNSGGWIGLSKPNVIQLNTRSGFFMRELKNPGNVYGWQSDRQGQIRLGLSYKGLKRTVIYRKNDKAAWVPLEGLGTDPLDSTPLGFTSDGKQLYVSKLSPQGRFALYYYDLGKDKIGDLILEHGLYDIDPLNRGGPISAPDGRLIGVRYYTDQAHSYWIDPDYAAIQQQLDTAVPDSTNRIVGTSNDEQRLLVFASSSQNPGTYYLFDRKDHTLGKFVDVMPWVDPAKMATKRPFKIKARDGLELYGYFTVPPGRKMKDLPMVVLVHGGPWARDTDGFESQVQFLANRGYAVLQINYRGSTGYGQEFYRKGFRVVGTTMQDDIEDATRWAIKAGIADPKRVAIMGGSFGGYSTLMGLIRTPDLYACGIDIAGVTNWAGLIRFGAAMQPTSYAFNADRIGDPVKDAAALRAISPVYHVDKIKAPLLIVHGRDDPVVPYSQAEELTDALDKAGKPYELIAKFNELHGIANYKNRIELFNRVERFLAKYMPAD